MSQGCGFSPTAASRPCSPPIALARGPPACDEGLESLPDWEAMAQAQPENLFDQQVHC